MKWISKGLASLLAVAIILGGMLAVFEGAAFLMAKRLPIELLLQLPGWVKDRLSDETFDRPGYRIPHKNEAVDHRELGMMVAPNLNVTLSTQEFSYRMVTDDRGFPNLERKAWDHPDWILTGDSNAMAAAVDPEKGWPSLAAQKKGKRLLNLANNGWTLFQFSQVLDREVPEARPEVVLVAFSMTILSQTGYEYAKASKVDSEIRGMITLQKQKQRVSGWRWNDLMPFTFATCAYLKERKSVKNASEIAFELEGKTTVYPLGKLRFYDRQNQIGGVMDWKGEFHEELFLQDLQKIQRFAAQRKAKLVMMYMPRKEEVYVPLLAEATPRNAEAIKRREEVLAGKYDFERFRNFIRTRVEQVGAQWLDPTPTLMRYARQGESLYWAYDTHANPLGNQRIAEYLVESLSP